MSNRSKLLKGIALVCALTWASASGASSSASSPEEAIEGTLSFWRAQSGGAGEEAWWDQFIEGFEDRHPGVVVDITRYSIDEYWTKMTAAFAAGEEPDVYYTETGNYLDRFVRNDLVAALDDVIDTSYYDPLSLEPYRGVDGALYGVPGYWSVYSVWRNVDLLAEHGIGEISTWDDFLQACQTLTDAGVVPLAFGNGGQDQWTTGSLFDAFALQYGGPNLTTRATYGEDGVSWTDPAVVHAAERLQDLAEANCFPDGFTGVSYQQMTEMFLPGEAAMIYNGSWFSIDVASTASFAVDLVPLPDGPDAVHSTASGQGVVANTTGIAASQRGVDENQPLVALFIDDLGAAIDDYANANGLLSVAAAPQPSGDPLQEAQAAALSNAEEVTGVSSINLPAVIQTDFLANLQALTAGDLTPEEFAQSMADATERERDELSAG